MTGIRSGAMRGALRSRAARRYAGRVACGRPRSERTRLESEASTRVSAAMFSSQAAMVAWVIVSSSVRSTMMTLSSVMSVCTSAVAFAGHDVEGLPAFENAVTSAVRAAGEAHAAMAS